MDLARVVSPSAVCPSAAIRSTAGSAAHNRAAQQLSFASIASAPCEALRGGSSNSSSSRRRYGSKKQESSRNVTRASLAQPEYAEGELDAPAWAGDTRYSAVVNALIGFKPLYALMKAGARHTLIDTAERNGVPWRRIAEDLEASEELRREKEALENKEIVYPDYYVQPFHAYDQGNLCWQAAFEVEAATLSMCRRAIPWASSAEEAAGILRQGWLSAVRLHHSLHSSGLPVDSVLDVGCSAGVSTRWLAKEFPQAEVTGLDASAYFLAVASLRAKQQQQQQQQQDQPSPSQPPQSAPPSRPITWLHALGEDTKLPSDSVSLVSFAFVFHECPPPAIRALLHEAKRVLKSGGTVAFTDNSPKSKIIQNLPAPIAALMKSTEPHADTYYLCNVEEMMRTLGYKNVTTVLSDPRHRTVTGTA